MIKNIINRIVCKLLFHDLIIIKQYTKSSSKLWCKRCKRYYGMNTDVRAFLPWDKELEDCMNLVSKTNKELEDE